MLAVIGGTGIYETIACDREPVWRVAGTAGADATPENKEKFEAYPTKDGRGLFMILPTVAAEELAKLDKSERYALTAGPATLGTKWAAEDRGLIVQLGEDIGAYDVTLAVDDGKGGVTEQMFVLVVSAG